MHLSSSGSTERGGGLARVLSWTLPALTPSGPNYFPRLGGPRWDLVGPGGPRTRAPRRTHYKVHSLLPLGRSPCHRRTSARLICTDFVVIPPPLGDDVTSLAVARRLLERRLLERRLLESCRVVSRGGEQRQRRPHVIGGD